LPLNATAPVTAEIMPTVLALRSIPHAENTESVLEASMRQPAESGGNTFAFRIFVTGDSFRSQRAVANLRGLCETSTGHDYSIEIVDVLADPALAEASRIIATPTVMRLSPPPARRLIGDLSNAKLASMALDLEPDETAATRKAG